MANKNQKSKTAIDTVSDIATSTGVLLMTAATTLGLVDVPAHPDRRAIVPNQPIFSFANATAEQEAQGNQLRREREETGPHYISYNISQRTPGRTGKI
jgi:hypothetical protein